MYRLVADYAARVAAFEKSAHDIFGRHESSASRVVLLDASYTRLQQLNIRQDELMRQALRCVEEELYRAAHVMAWSAFMDFYEEILASDGLVALRRERPKWKHVSSIEELREYESEFALLELAQPLSLASKNEMKDLQSRLNKRNQCAHPSSYTPDLNTTLGYVTEILQHMKLLAGKSPK